MNFFFHNKSSFSSGSAPTATAPKCPCTALLWPKAFFFPFSFSFLFWGLKQTSKLCKAQSLSCLIIMQRSEPTLFHLQEESSEAVCLFLTELINCCALEKQRFSSIANQTNDSIFSTIMSTTPSKYFKYMIFISSFSQKPRWECSLNAPPPPSSQS